jgi:hypothetical protein
LRICRSSREKDRRCLRPTGPAKKKAHAKAGQRFGSQIVLSLITNNLALPENDMPKLAILVVDDEPQRGLISALLSKCGHPMVSCANGTQGWATVESSNSACALVVSDYQMPGTGRDPRQTIEGADTINTGQHDV